MTKHVQNHGKRKRVRIHVRPSKQRVLGKTVKIQTLRPEDSEAEILAHARRLKREIDEAKPPDKIGDQGLRSRKAIEEERRNPRYDVIEIEPDSDDPEQFTPGGETRVEYVRTDEADFAEELASEIDRRNGMLPHDPRRSEEGDKFYRIALSEPLSIEDAAKRWLAKGSGETHRRRRYALRALSNLVYRESNRRHYSGDHTPYR